MILLKVDSCLIKVPIQGMRLWQRQNVPLDGGGGGPNGRPSSIHHDEPLVDLRMTS